MLARGPRTRARSRCRAVLAAAGALLALFPAPTSAQSADWQAVFDPLQLLTLHLEMSHSDWNTVQNDDSFSVEVPAWFHADGDAPILVSVRRKSATALGAASGFKKVSLKIDINDFVVGQSWRGLKKLSLENGDDMDVVAEGTAWWIERLASGVRGYGHRVSHAAWVRLFINGVNTGVYVNVEQVDKRFLENRGLFVEGTTWLYKVSDVGSLDRREGGPQDSPTVDALCYPPFDIFEPCPTPDLATHVPQYVDLQGMLTEMVSDAFQANRDALLTKGKNFFFADFLGGRLRMHFPWDRDSSLPSGAADSTIYPRGIGGGAYDGLLDVPAFRAQYNRIFNDLICGPWSEASLLSFLDAVEPVVSAALAADPNFGGGAAGRFDALRSWLSRRIASATVQIEGFQACPTVQVTLNELMADNTGFLQDPAEPGEFPDWIEIHNPTGAAVDLGGLYLTDDLTRPTKFQIASGVTLPANGHLIFYADEDSSQGPRHVNFKLSASGEVVAIYDRDGVRRIDAIPFDAQMADVSFGRFPNGAGAWDVMSTPTPEAPNGPHNAPPVIAAVTRTPAAPAASDPVRINAMVTDDTVVAAVTLHYDAGAGWVTITMLDDGRSGDGAAGDQVYAAGIPPQPTNTIVRYYLAATDGFGARRSDPHAAPALTHRYVVGYVPPALFLNEFMADNETAVPDPDEPLAHEDWIEIFNPGAASVDLGGKFLSDDPDVPRKHQIPAGLFVPAGGYALFWADGEPLQGPAHTSFSLNAGGEQIGLFDTDARGNVPIDVVTFGAQLPDVSQGRCPDGSGVWQQFTTATPGARNQPCSTLPQACCFRGGSCQDLDADHCAASGGTPQGTGSACASARCPACLADEDCDDGVLCTLGTCDLASFQCRQNPFDSVCDDGIACTADRCDAILGCRSEPGGAAEVGATSLLNQTTLSWMSTPDATHWNAYRGTIPDAGLASRSPASPYDHVCHESADALSDGATTATVTAVPPLGTAHYFLVTGENQCAESVPGRSSSDAPIPQAFPCPTPP